MHLRNFKLPTEAKRHIIVALARRERHAEIVAQVKTRFGVSIHRRAIRHYQPKYNPRLAEELRALYEETREQIMREWERESALRYEQSQQRAEAEQQAFRARMKAELGMK